MKRNIRQLVLVLALLMLAMSSARATTLTISAQTVPDIRYGGTFFTMRFYVDAGGREGFTSSDSIFHLAGAVGSNNVYKTVTCTLSGTTGSCPSFTIDTTTDALDVTTTKYQVALYDSKGAARGMWFSNMVVPASLAPTTDWTALRQHNRANTIANPPNTYYTADQVNRLLSQNYPCSNASDSVKGCAKLSVQPVSSSNPIAVGDNDPRMGQIAGRQVFNVVAYGAIPDDGLNDYVGVYAALTAASNAGGGVVKFPCGTFQWRGEDDNNVGVFGGVSILGTPGCTIIKRDPTSSSSARLYVGSELSAYNTYTAGTAAIAANVNSLTLNTVSGLSVGNDILLQLGDDPTDCCRTGSEWQKFAKITNIAGNVITFLPAIEEAVADIGSITDGVTGQPKKHNVRKVLKMAKGVEIAYLHFDMEGSVGNRGGAWIDLALNSHIHDLTSNYADAGLALVTNSENCTVDRISVQKASNVSGVTGGWALRNCTFRNIKCDDCPNTAIDFQLQNRNIVVQNVELKASGVGTFNPFIQFGGATKGAIVKDASFYNSSSATHRVPVSGSHPIITENFSLKGNIRFFVSNNHVGYLTMDDLVFNNPVTISKTISVPSSFGGAKFTVDGIPTSIRVYTPSLTGLTRFSYGYYFDGAGGVTASPTNLLSQLQAGKLVALTEDIGIDRNNSTGAIAHQQLVWLETDGTWTNGQYITLVITYYPYPPAGGNGIVVARPMDMGDAIPMSGLFFENAVLFADLPVRPNFTQIPCSNCTHGSSPCTGGGTGAIAKRLNGAWVCN